MFDIKSFLNDFQIPYWEKGKNTQNGWIQIQCPLCDDDSNHGGFNLITGHYNCWKCGHEFTDKIISAILNITIRESKQIIKEYDINYIRQSPNKKKSKKKNKILELPPGTESLSERHKNYLIKRNFDPYEIIYYWNVKGTQHYGDYRFRIIAPIIIDGKMISYQGRDITNKQELRYKACRIEDEIIHHKNIVYGIDMVKYEKAILVEGITDAWRFGRGAIAIFGTTYTIEQIKFMNDRLKELFILFDPGDKIAKKKADELGWSLPGLKIEKIEIDFESDPGELPQEEASYIKKQLLDY